MKKLTSRIFSLTGLWLALALVPIGISSAFYAWAGDEDHYKAHHLSPEQLVKLQKDGSILSLEQIIDLVRRDKEDRLLEVELLENNGYLFYKVELLQKSGIVKKYLLDARSGEPIAGQTRGD